jgi:hypothetical protein
VFGTLPEEFGGRFQGSGRVSDPNLIWGGISVYPFSDIYYPYIHSQIYIFYGRVYINYINEK